jgi:FecR-like protein
VSGDYLWDGSGEPEAEVRRLEEILRPLRGTRPPPELHSLRPQSAVPVGGWRTFAAAAAVLLALAAVLTRGRHAEPAAGWDLAWLEGASWPQARVVREARLGVGEWIDTGKGRARLSVGEIGEVQLEPSTRVRLVDAGDRSHRLSLSRGLLHATIWAPPGQFLVDTPSAVAVDLGCRYTLEVAQDGAGLLRVEAGWVGFESRGLQSLVPAGAACPTRRGIGPGTPYYETAPEALSRALAVLDFGSDPAERDAALAALLASARERDALSLWHLLARVDGDARGRVFDRLAALVPPPAEVTREGVLRGDAAMRDAWWDELGLGSADFWRGWTGRWSDGR